jgi:hypothetical protein
MAFSVLISEEGGTERRESFGRSEVTIGRVQGNDLMLPKGNVSKRHARIILRDNRCVIEDLKSTNGTYVNGRRITQATIVRDGDKVYVGDFVLRVLPLDGAADVHSTAAGSAVEIPVDFSTAGSGRLPAITGANRDAGAFKATAVHGELVRPSVMAEDSHGTVSSNDSLSAQERAVIEAAGRSPSKSAAATPAAAVAQPAALDRRLAALQSAVVALQSRMDLTPCRKEILPSREYLAQLDRELKTTVLALQESKTIAVDHPMDQLVADVKAELIGLGPLDALLRMPNVAEVRVIGPTYVMARIAGSEQRQLPFLTEASVRMALERLCAAAGPMPAPPPSGTDEERSLVPGDSHAQLGSGAAGHTGETTGGYHGDYIVERDLGGLALFAQVHQNGMPSLLLLRRSVRPQCSLADLVKSDALSREMAQLLTARIEAGASVLVVGAPDLATPTLIALAAAQSAAQHSVWFSDARHPNAVRPAPGNPQLAQLELRKDPSERRALLREVGSLAHECIALPQAWDDDLHALLTQREQGGGRMIVGVSGPSTRQALHRMASGLVARGHLQQIDAGRSWIASFFDIAIEVGTHRDGRLKFIRVLDMASGDGQAHELKPSQIGSHAGGVVTSAAILGTVGPS